MELMLRQLVPQSFASTITEQTSDVWKKEIKLSAGEYVSVVAPAGYGKTMLIEMLYGLRNDYDGDILSGDTTWRQISANRWAQLRAGYISAVFQDLRLFPELTLWQNLEVKRSLTHTVQEERVLEMLRSVGLAEKRDAVVQQLSQGEKQLTAIVRALLQPFEWLLLDEPFSHLDMINTDRAIALIRQMADAQKAGVLLTSLRNNQYFPYHKTLFL